MEGQYMEYMGGFGTERWVSFGVSWTFVWLALWGAIAFFPKRKDRGNTAPAWLILAIWCGFVGAGLNVLYWRVFGDLATYFGWFTIYEIRAFGNTYGDIVWKGLGCISIYLHFFARWKAISLEEQKYWRPLLMGFYPDANHWAVRTMTFWLTAARDEFYSKAEQAAQDREDK